MHAPLEDWKTGTNPWGRCDIDPNVIFLSFLALKLASAGKEGKNGTAIRTAGKHKVRGTGWILTGLGVGFFARVEWPISISKEDREG